MNALYILSDAIAYLVGQSPEMRNDVYHPGRDAVKILEALYTLVSYTQ